LATIEEIVKNIREAIREAQEHLKRGLHFLAVNNAFFACECTIILLCRFAYERGYIGRVPTSHRGRLHVVSELCRRGIIPQDIALRYSRVLELRSRIVYAFKNGEAAREIVSNTIRIVSEVMKVLGVGLDVEEY